MLMIGKLVEIRAPLAGVIHLKSSDDGQPFVEVGKEIESGQVLCVIEAMKMMNEIRSKVAGKIVDILVKHSQPINAGHRLFLIRPAE